LADRDRRIQYWRTKFEVAELERTMVQVKKDQAVEALRGREVWFDSYLRSCYTAMAGVCRDLRVPRGNPESAAEYISWLNGACSQLEGIGKAGVSSIEPICWRARASLYPRSLPAAIPRVPPRRVFTFSEDSRRERGSGEVDGAACRESLPVHGLALAFLVVFVSCDKYLRETCNIFWNIYEL
jgi:hypothetical protein